jgi:hypothetical protein
MSWNMLLYSDTQNEVYHDSEDKITLFIENKTNETLVIRIIAFDGQLVGAELIRIPPKQGEVAIRVTKERKIRILGGNTGKLYIEMVCAVDNETVIVSPSVVKAELREWGF